MRRRRFSALQRAENSSIGAGSRYCRPRSPFQCSSASRKFLNRSNLCQKLRRIATVSVLFSEPKIPQSIRHRAYDRAPSRFSALQRAENSSIAALRGVSNAQLTVSVLFSEPKIPQYIVPVHSVTDSGEFQCSSASRKFLNGTQIEPIGKPHRGFSALQRAENSSIARIARSTRSIVARFSALQRAENSSIINVRDLCIRQTTQFQCSSASRKFLNSHSISSRIER